MPSFRVDVNVYRSVELFGAQIILLRYYYAQCKKLECSFSPLKTYFRISAESPGHCGGISLVESGSISDPASLRGSRVRTARTARASRPRVPEGVACSICALTLEK